MPLCRLAYNENEACVLVIRVWLALQLLKPYRLSDILKRDLINGYAFRKYDIFGRVRPRSGEPIDLFHAQ